MKVVALALALFAVGDCSEESWKKEFTTADYDSLDLKSVFEDWKTSFGRGYPTIHEESLRFKIWAANLDSIIEHNSADLTYTLRLNQFADLTSDEFRMKVHGHKGSCLDHKPRHRFADEHKPAVIGNRESRRMEPRKTAPDSIDWLAIVLLFYFNILFLF